MANVPSNLIPSRVTQLPIAPVASPDGLLLFTYQGVSWESPAPATIHKNAFYWD